MQMLQLQSIAGVQRPSPPQDYSYKVPVNAQFEEVTDSIKKIFFKEVVFFPLYTSQGTRHNSQKAK